MSYIDIAVLNLTEWFCHRFQRLTGRTNIWLAVQLTNLSIVVYFVWAGVFFWDRGLALRVALGLFCGALFYVLTQTVFKVSITAYELSAYQRVAKGFRNPRRLRDAPLRISFLTLSLVLPYPVWLAHSVLHLPLTPMMYLLIVLTTAVLYLLACDPLPPCVGRVREWLQRFVPARAAAAQQPGVEAKTAVAAAVRPAGRVSVSGSATVSFSVSVNEESRSVR